MKLGLEVKNGEQSLNPESFFLIQPPQQPQPLYPLPNPPQHINFANFGQILIKLGKEVKNGEESWNLEFKVIGMVLPPILPSRQKPPQTLSLPILVKFWIKFGMGVTNGEQSSWDGFTTNQPTQRPRLKSPNRPLWEFWPSFNEIKQSREAISWIIKLQSSKPLFLLANTRKRM